MRSEILCVGNIGQCTSIGNASNLGESSAPENITRNFSGSFCQALRFHDSGEGLAAVGCEPAFQFGGHL
jgi:hypothetical protein